MHSGSQTVVAQAGSAVSVGVTAMYEQPAIFSIKSSESKRLFAMLLAGVAAVQPVTGQQLAPRNCIRGCYLRYQVVMCAHCIAAA